MQQNYTLDGLLKSLNQDAGIVTEWLNASSLPTPSLTVPWPNEIPSQLHAVRQRLAVTAKTLSRLVAGPDEHLRELAMSPLNTSALRWILHHHVPEAVDLQHGSSHADIAKACNVDQGDLERMVRFCAHDLIFYEPVPGHVAHTVASAALATPAGLRAFVSMSVNDLRQITAKLIEAQEKWPRSQEATHSSFNLAYNTDAHFFEYLSRPGQEAGVSFIDVMEYENKLPVYDVRHVMEAYDWQSVDSIVDIGGGSGDLGLALAKAYPHLRVIVADREVIIATKKTRILEGMMPRLEFIAYDFFSPLPDSLAQKKTFLLRRILHDWSDKFAAKILQNLLPAMQTGARVLVMDSVLPEPGEVPEEVDRTIRSLDMMMKHGLNGKERSRDEWRKLFASVDKDLVIKSITRPEGSALSLLEVELVTKRDA